MNMDDENLEITRSISNLTEMDNCNECDEKRQIVCCDKCANAVCTNSTCCILFPHHGDSVFAICKSCKNEIESKLKLVVDIDKLKLLKRKIKRRTMNKTY